MKGRVFMSIRKRKSKKATKGYTYQVYFDYTDKYGQKKTYIKGGFLKKTDALNHETLKKSELLTSVEKYTRLIQLLLTKYLNSISEVHL